MRTVEFYPEGFEPQLLGYFTPFDLTTARTGTKRGKLRSPEELENLNVAVRAFEAVNRTGLAIGDLEGIQVWSTNKPNATFTEVILRNPAVSIQIPFVSLSDRQALLGFFRDNVRDIPEVTEGWFNIPYPLDDSSSMPEDEAQRLNWTVLEKLAKGESPDGSYSQFEYDNLHGDLKREADIWLRYTQRLKQHSALEAIQFANSRIRETRNRFTGEDLEVAQFWVYSHRAGIQGYLVDKGGFRNLPNGNKLRSLAVLSEAIDLMRADTVYGSLTLFRAEKIANRFGDAGIKALQRKVTQRVIGKPFSHIDPTPSDPEIAFIQKRVLATLGSINS